MRGVPEGRGIALPYPAYPGHQTRRRLWHTRHRTARSLPAAARGSAQGLAATYTCSGITAFSALKKTRGHLGTEDHLVIIGAGGVGGSAVHIAPAAVAGKVIVADIDAQKRAHARQMGAVETIDNAAPDAVKQVMEATDGGAAAAIDFVGSPKTMEFGRQYPAKRRQARHGRALRRSLSDLDRAVPVQDDDHRGLLCGHARGSEGASRSR